MRRCRVEQVVSRNQFGLFKALTKFFLLGLTVGVFVQEEEEKYESRQVTSCKMVHYQTIPTEAVCLEWQEVKFPQRSSAWQL